MTEENRLEAARRVHSHIQAVQANIAQKTIELGRWLQEMCDKELWYDLSYQSFDDYCLRVCGFGEAGAALRIRIMRAFKDIDISSREILPVTKMAIVSCVVYNKQTAKQWLRLGRKLSCAELRKQVREHRKKLAKKGEVVAIPSARFRLMGLTFTEREEKTVRRTIRTIIDAGEAKTFGEAVYKMATTYSHNHRAADVA